LGLRTHFQKGFRKEKMQQAILQEPQAYITEDVVGTASRLS